MNILFTFIMTMLCACATFVSAGALALEVIAPDEGIVSIITFAGFTLFWGYEADKETNQ